ncbi:short-chain dehydrogenase/reductase family 16C member 6-like [Centruroides vittatus]|uniref:short-chain dehydrogenase/reductase family 16C member 6-like n=1 Tax=Centruroides vittatus TaxID=120091 RepID=UPI003510CD2F
MKQSIGVLLLNIFLLIIEVVQLVLKSFWYSIESLYENFVPPTAKSVRDDIVLITGGGHGLGKELALRFARLGAIIVLWDVNQVGTEAVVQEIKELNGKAFAYHCDVSNEKCVEETSEKVKKDVGQVSILINNAGMVNCRELLHLSCQQIRRTLEVNTLAHFWTIRAFLPEMIRKEKGHIVAISSLAGLLGSTNLTDYCASKFAVNGLMSSLGEELYYKKKNVISLTTVCPAVINTGFAPLPPVRFSSLLPVLNVTEVADKVVDGILRNRRLIVLPGWLDFWTRLMRLFPWKDYNCLECL